MARGPRSGHRRRASAQPRCLAGWILAWLPCRLATQLAPIACLAWTPFAWPLGCIVVFLLLCQEGKQGTISLRVTLLWGQPNIPKCRFLKAHGTIVFGVTMLCRVQWPSSSPERWSQSWMRSGCQRVKQPDYKCTAAGWLRLVS